MRSILIIAVLFFCSTIFNKAQTPGDLIKQGKELLNKGSIYIDVGYLVEAEQHFQEALVLDEENYFAQYFLAYSDYRLAIYYMQNEDDEQFKNYIKLSKAELKTILDSDDKDPEALALLASDYGEEIREDSSLAPQLAPKALAMISEVIEIAPDNPRVQLLAGKLILTLPEKYGGNKVKALVHLQKSVNLFEANREADDPIGWGYIFALTWLGINYTELNDYATAAKIYNKALEVEPDFLWINNVLLPDVENKLNTPDE